MRRCYVAAFPAPPCPPPTTTTTTTTTHHHPNAHLYGAIPGVRPRPRAHLLV